MKNLILLLAIICFISCQKKDKTYYEDGTLKTIAEVSDSKFHGSYKSYYESGELEIEANYKNGLMHGLATYYYKSNDKYSRTESLFVLDTANYQWSYNNSGDLVEEGYL